MSDRRGRPARAAAAALLRARGGRARARLAGAARRTPARRALPRVDRAARPPRSSPSPACRSCGPTTSSAGVELLTYFTVPVRAAAGAVARSPFPDWAPRALARVGDRRSASLFAVVGLYQAATRELFFFAPNLAVSNANSDYFRVTSLFGDPSLYGRHVVLGIGILLVALALRRVDLPLGVALLVLLWAGLFFSYSQSSMVALVAVTLGVAAATGGRRVRRWWSAGWSPWLRWSAPATWPRSRSAATRCAGRPATAPSASRTRCAWSRSTRSSESASAASRGQPAPGRARPARRRTSCRTPRRSRWPPSSALSGWRSTLGCSWAARG